MPVVLVHAFRYKDDDNARDVIVCDSGASAQYWATRYRDAGWREVRVSGYHTPLTVPINQKEQCLTSY